MQVERVKEMFMQFGMTAQWAQIVEAQLVRLLVVGKVADKNEITMESISSAQSTLSTKTLGNLINTLRQASDVEDATLETIFSEALKQRNYLTHRFFEHHESTINTTEGIETMILELQSMRALFKRADSAFTALTDRALAYIGISPDVLDAAMRDFYARN